MVFYLNNRKVGVCGGKRKWLPAQGASSQEWPIGDKSRLVGGKNPGQAVTQGQSGNGQHPCDSPQVVSYVAFNVKPVRVRVGASPVALISAYTNQPVAIPTTR